MYCRHTRASGYPEPQKLIVFPIKRLRINGTERDSRIRAIENDGAELDSRPKNAGREYHGGRPQGLVEDIAPADEAAALGDHHHGKALIQSGTRYRRRPILASRTEFDLGPCASEPFGYYKLFGPTQSGSIAFALPVT